MVWNANLIIEINKVKSDRYITEILITSTLPAKIISEIKTAHSAKYLLDSPDLWKHKNAQGKYARTP